VAAFLDQLTVRRAAEIGERARRRILAQHTYGHRAAAVISALSLLRKRETNLPPRASAETLGEPPT
jgi:spore maturation protein CgeB